MPAQAREKSIYRFGECEIDLTRRELRIGGNLVPVGARAFEILEALAEAAGQLVNKNELMDRIWGDAPVGESTLQVHISAVRKALGTQRGMLKTESGRGYRLLGDRVILQENTSARTQQNEPLQIPALSALTNLPAPTLGLIGRADVVRQLRDLLSAYRTVTLTGPGGIGKTTLAIEVARGALDSFDRGAWLVELAVISDPDFVPSAVASLLGLNPTGGMISSETVARAIGGQQLLLVLDNCEHVIDAVAELAETITRNCPRTTVLATSREVLRIDGEYVYRVPPLDVPLADEGTPDDLLRHSAVELFIARTGALRSDFQPQIDDLSTIAAICRHLDGIPLAIEFAAARAAALGLAEVASHLDDRFRFLTGGRRTALPRHQTLRATLDWSYDLLPDPEQLLLRRLAVFSAGFTLDAAAAVMGNTTPSTVAEGMANLVAKSLVTRDGSVPAGRWRLLETIRIYAREKLAEAGELEPARRNHAVFFRDLFGAAGPSGQLQLPAEHIAHYSPEIDNVRTALDWAFSARGDAEIAVTLTIVAVPLWMQLSLMEECRERVDQALEALRGLPEPETRHEMRLQAARAVSLMFTKGLVPEVAAAAARSRELAESVGSTEYQLRALWRLWSYYISSGGGRAALELAETLHTLAVEQADLPDQLIGERILGVSLHYLGEQPSARRHLDRMLSRYAASLHQSHVIRFQRDQGLAARAFLARVLWLQGFADQAIRIVHSCVEEALATGHALSICPTLAEMACPLAIEIGDFDLAARYIRMLLEHSARHALVYWGTWGRSFEAELATRTGDATAALQVLRAGWPELGDAVIAARFMPPQGVLAAACHRAGEVAQGLTAIGEALEWSERTEQRLGDPELLRIKGELIVSSGDADAAAEDYFRQSIDLARQQGALAWELRAALSLARLRMTQNRRLEARRILEPIYDRFTEGFATADLAAAKTCLDSLPD